MNGVTILDFDDLEAMVKRLVKQINNIADDEDERRVLRPEDKTRAKVLAGMLDTLRRTPIVAPSNEESTAKDDPEERSEERRVGKECVSTCRSGCARDH